MTHTRNTHKTKSSRKKENMRLFGLWKKKKETTIQIADKLRENAWIGYARRINSIHS